MRTRFAPSPTGDLHLGGAYVALAAFTRARAGTFVVRIEDLDPPRVIPGAEARILADLAWLGLCADEGVVEGGAFGPYRQSERAPLYIDAIAALDALGLVYPCTCSRAEIARVASAPHVGEEGPRYPGTCRDPKNRRSDRTAALRLRVPDDDRALVEFEDGVRGAQKQDVAATVGDFVLRRSDGVFAYQLAVAVDDVAMHIDEVVRGDDLLDSTPRQILLVKMLQARLGGSVPRYAHVPVLRGPDGHRLAKRHQATTTGTTIAELRSQGVDAREVIEALRRALGVDAPRSSRTQFDIPLRPDHRWTIPPAWLRLRRLPTRP